MTKALRSYFNTEKIKSLLQNPELAAEDYSVIEQLVLNGSMLFKSGKVSKAFSEEEMQILHLAVKFGEKDFFVKLREQGVDFFRFDLKKFVADDNEDLKQIQELIVSAVYERKNGIFDFFTTEHPQGTAEERHRFKRLTEVVLTKRLDVYGVATPHILKQLTEEFKINPNELLKHLAAKNNAEGLQCLIDTAKTKKSTLDLNFGTGIKKPIMVACVTGSFDAVEVLARNGAALNNKTDNGQMLSLDVLKNIFAQNSGLYRRLNRTRFLQTCKTMRDHGAITYFELQNNNGKRLK